MLQLLVSGRHGVEYRARVLNGFGGTPPSVSVSRGATLGEGRKTDPGTRFRNPGTDGTASEFPAKGAGNPWQSRQSPEGTMRARPVFHELSRAEGPSQQTGLPANFRQGAPEIHGSRVMRKHLIRG